MEELVRLREIIRTLREPGGCDWDRAQDWGSMRPHLVEEAYEVIDAVDRNAPADVCEELGDVLFLVHFFARLAEEDNRFNIDDVARSINEKLIRRHPHVFGQVRVNGVADILRNWEEIKRQEEADAKAPAEANSGTDTAPATAGGSISSARSGQPPANSILKKSEGALPALFRAAKIQEKVARVGFDWPNPEGVLEKIAEESRELAAELQAPDPDAAETKQRVEDELGDLLFSVVNLSRHIGANPELALQGATDRFVRRFRDLESALAGRGTTVAESTPAQLDQIWEEVKRAHA